MRADEHVLQALVEGEPPITAEQPTPGQDLEAAAGPAPLLLDLALPRRVGAASFGQEAKNCRLLQCGSGPWQFAQLMLAAAPRYA